MDGQPPGTPWLPASVVYGGLLEEVHSAKSRVLRGGDAPSGGRFGNEAGAGGTTLSPGTLSGPEQGWTRGRWGGYLCRPDPPCEHRAPEPGVVLRVVFTSFRQGGVALVKFICVDRWYLLVEGLALEQGSSAIGDFEVFRNDFELYLPDIASGVCFPKTASILALPPEEASYFLRHHRIHSICASMQDTALGTFFHPASPPMFDNVCGGTKIAPVLNLTTELASGRYRAFQKTRSAFGECLEAFTAFGNIMIRRSRDGYSVISFKGCKGTKALCGLLEEILGKQLYDECLRCRIPCDGAGEGGRSGALFGVHMAVVTMNIGRRLCVFIGCLLEVRIQQIFGQMGAIQSVFRTDEEGNAVKFQINDWDKLYTQVLLANLEYKMPRVPCCAPGNATVSVTSRGAMISRFSWPRSVEWTDEMAESVLRHCEIVGMLIAACC